VAISDNAVANRLHCILITTAQRKKPRLHLDPRAARLALDGARNALARAVAPTRTRDASRRKKISAEKIASAKTPMKYIFFRCSKFLTATTTQDARTTLRRRDTSVWYRC